MAELTYESAFPGRFTKAALFEGKRVTLTIAKAYMEVLEGDKGKQNKLIFAFKETPKELVVCKTNAFCLVEMFGNRIKDWEGKRITFYPTKTAFGPKQVDAIRVFGSPDIREDVEVNARIGRKQFKTTLKRIGNGTTSPPLTPMPPSPLTPDPNDDPPPDYYLSDANEDFASTRDAVADSLGGIEAP